MSEMTAWERIYDIVVDFTGEGDPVEEILDIVREALLSEEAKEAASYFASYDDIPAIVDSLMNAGLGTRFVTNGYDEPFGCTND